MDINQYLKTYCWLTFSTSQVSTKW